MVTLFSFLSCMHTLYFLLNIKIKKKIPLCIRVYSLKKSYCIYYNIWFHVSIYGWEIFLTMNIKVHLDILLIKIRMILSGVSV